jgi:hypothetical protein
MKVGGWAALVAAVAILVEIAAIISATGPVDARLASPFLFTVEVVRAFGLIVVAIAISSWLREIDPRLAPIASSAGIVGSGIGLAGDAAQLLNVPPSSFDLALFVVANGGIGCWFILSGSIIGRASDDLRRVGSVGQLGGAGWLLATGGTVVFNRLPVQAGGGPWVVPYALFLSLFGVLYLVRLWQAAALGRLPGPGLI